MDSKPPPMLNTIWVMAQRLGVPPKIIRDVLAHHPEIRPSAMANRTRLFDEVAFAAIAEAIQAAQKEVLP